MVSAYHRRLFGENDAERRACARAWSRWEGATVTMATNLSRVNAISNDTYALAFARIEAHYFYNKGFMEEDGQLLRDLPKITHLPATIVQGRYDLVTPPINAYRLHKAWPGSTLVIAPDAGHAVSEKGIASALVTATDAYAGR